MRLVLIACTAAVLALTGCGGGGDQASSRSPSPSATVGSAPKELGTLKASGFGQADEYVWATAVVHNNSDYVGQTVTVSFNVLDAAGEILSTESQVEWFVRPGADHVIGTQVALEPGQKAAKVEASLDVEAAGTFSDQPFPDMPVSDLKMTADTGGYPAVTFVVSNPLTVPLKDARIQLACTDASGAIIGGGSDYPALIPAGGKIKVDAHVIASSNPKDCTVFVGALDWEGVPSAVTPTGPVAPNPRAQAPAGSAEDAFKVWVGQFGKRNWKAQYQTLVNAQRKVVSAERLPRLPAGRGPAQGHLGQGAQHRRRRQDQYPRHQSFTAVDQGDRSSQGERAQGARRTPTCSSRTAPGSGQ